ncbi:MAG: hypothetical protein ABIH92_02575 [Nanoarchaeota archaeon]
MFWQDVVIAIVNVLFSYALIPQVYKGFKHKKGFVVLQTGVITTVGLYVMAATFVTLELYFATVITILTGTLWLLLLLQTIVYGKARKA